MLKRTFKIDIKRCESCGHDALKIIAYITELTVVTTILKHLGLPHITQQPQPARHDPQLDIDLDEIDQPASEERDYDINAQNPTRAPPN